MALAKPKSGYYFNNIESLILHRVSFCGIVTPKKVYMVKVKLYGSMTIWFTQNQNNYTEQYNITQNQNKERN